MIINHNMASLNTYNKLSSNTSATAKSLEKLSSGLRINKAGDDAAGLAISEKMRGQIRGLDQATRNAQDGISLIQTAEGSLSETQSILQRMKELATQSANDTNVTADRSEIQKELNQLTSEINRIGNTTEFNTQKLLKGKDVAVVATAQDVATTTAGVAGVVVGATTDLAINAKSVVAIQSSASLQGNSSAATGRVSATDQTTVSVKGANSSIVVSGLSFTSTTLSSATPNGGTININQLANATGTASTITTTGTGSSAIVSFNIGTDADGKSLFTGTNRGELTNYLKGIAGYATSGVTITVPEDPNANGPASAEALINMPDSTAVATASTIYSGALTGGVTEVRGVSTFSIEEAIKEDGDTITVGGQTFTGKSGNADETKGEFDIDRVSSYIQAGNAAVATTALTVAAGSDKIDIKVGATTFTIDDVALSAYGTNSATATNDDLVNLFKNADFTGAKLSSVADVSIGTDNKIQIIAKNAALGTNVEVTATYGDASIKALTGFAANTGVKNYATKAGADFGATAADQARSLRVAINANATMGTHYAAAGTTNSGEIAMTEKATKATGESLATVTTAGAGVNDKLNIADLSGKNLSQINIVKGIGLDITGQVAKTDATIDGAMQLTSGTKSAELQGVKIAFAGLADGTVTSLSSTWDAASQTLNVTGSVATGETNTGWGDALESQLRTALGNAGFKGAAGLTVTDGAVGTSATIMSTYNGKSMTFGGGIAATNAAGALVLSSNAATGNEFHGVNIAFKGLASNGTNPTALTSSWDAATKTVTVTGAFEDVALAATVDADILASVQSSLTSAGYSAAGVAALNVSTSGATVGSATAAALNGKAITFNNNGGIDEVAAHTMAVDQKNGNLTITLSDDTVNSNAAAKIQAAVQALGTVKSSSGDVDFSKYQFTAEGNWDSKALGENIIKSNASLVGGTKEVKGDYSFDITKAFAVGDKVNVKGQIFTAVASGAIGSKNEFDVASGDINNQAISLRNAIGLNSVLSATYTVGGTGSTIKMTELQATGTDLKKTDLAVKATGTAGEYSVDTSTLLENGAAFVLDGKEIMVSNKTANVGYDNGTAVKVADSGAAQTAALADAINKNADLKIKYTASVGADGNLVLKQNEMEESATAPVVATKNSSVGQFTSSLQIGANSGQSMTVDVGDMRAASLGVSGDGSVGTVAAKNGKVASYVETANTTDGTNNTSVEYSLDVSSHDKATNAISVLDDAIQAVSAERSKLGAFQNRLEHTISNLGTSSENLTGAESRIRDVDMAKEMMQFQKNNILAQAATAMLAQANQQPQGVLQLLR